MRWVSFVNCDGGTRRSHFLWSSSICFGGRVFGTWYVRHACAAYSLAIRWLCVEQWTLDTGHRHTHAPVSESNLLILFTRLKCNLSAFVGTVTAVPFHLNKSASDRTKSSSVIKKMICSRCAFARITSLSSSFFRFIHNWPTRRIDTQVRSGQVWKGFCDSKWQAAATWNLIASNSKFIWILFFVTWHHCCRRYHRRRCHTKSPKQSFCIFFFFWCK